VSQSKHKSQCVSGLARDSTSDPISLDGQKSEHKRRNTQSSLWYNKSKPAAASAERLLTGRRGHWSIENKSHWMRGTVLGEDASPVRCGAIPQVMAANRNTALSVRRFAGYTAISDTIKYLASKPKLAINLIK